jgi:hypothetical protein
MYMYSSCQKLKDFALSMRESAFFPSADLPRSSGLKSTAHGFSCAAVFYACACFFIISSCSFCISSMYLYCCLMAT